MKKIARVLLTLVIVAAGCVGGYELWDYYLFSPWTRRGCALIIQA